MTSQNICIAAGSKSNKLGVKGEEYCLNSDSFFKLDAMPEKLLVIGAGYIACELAHIAATLGSWEVVMKVRSGVLSNFDDEIAEIAK